MPESRFPDIANAEPLVDAALKDAAEAGEAVILVLGADWCPDARAFAGFLDAEEMQAALAGRARVLRVDIGRHDRNQNLVRRFGLGRRLEGVPAVLVLDAGGGVVNPADVYRWRTARSADPAMVADWLSPLVDTAKGPRA